MTINGFVNGHSAVTRALKPGIYAPIPSFFLPESEDLGVQQSLHPFASSINQAQDLPTFEKHVAKVALAGVAPVVAGSMGEAPHLSHEERIALIRAARKVLDANGLTHLPVIAGTGAPSTRETIELTRQAAAAGADYALVVASGYFAGALIPNRQALKDFWTEVSTKSPIPIMIYNCKYLLESNMQHC
jgi:4-hydroxy-2-oxoglutarate aldolase